MKKIISILVVLSMLCGMFALTSVAADDGITLTVANDIHYNKAYTTTARKSNYISEDFAHVTVDEKMASEGLAIITAFLEAAGENESDYVIIPGDIADYGLKEEAEFMANMFREFEAKYNKQVYVVPGNHDLSKMPYTEFVKIFAEFGYNEAIAKHDKTGSYVVDLKNGYRLIGIDSCTQGTGKHGINADLVNWVSAQCKQAKADGKNVFAMMHHNLLEHFILGSTIHSGGVVGPKVAGFADALAKGGVKYIFTGHTHDSDVAMYTADDGSIIYDVVTPTLLSYTCPYRVVDFGKNVKIETRNIDKIDTSILPSGISETALALAESDFTEYSRVCTWIGLEALFVGMLTGKGLADLLKLEDKELEALIIKVGDKLGEVLNMPFEKEDEIEEGKSIESLAEKYDVEIPDSDYKNLIDLAITYYVAHNMGDENIPTYSDEAILLTRGVATALGYALSDVTAEEYASVMSLLVGLADVNIPVDFFYYAGDAIKRMEGIEIYVTLVLVPFIGEFSTDDAPADNFVTLPGYDVAEGEDAADVKGETIWDKITNFFEKIFGVVRTIFAFLPWVN